MPLPLAAIAGRAASSVAAKAGVGKTGQAVAGRVVAGRVANMTQGQQDGAQKPTFRGADLTNFRGY